MTVEELIEKLRAHQKQYGSQATIVVATPEHGYYQLREVTIEDDQIVLEGEV